MASLETYRNAGTSALLIQMAKLLEDPLRAMSKSSSEQSRPIAIVLDALDECEGRELVDQFLRLLSHLILNLPADFPFKVFITSRPEPHIMRVLRGDDLNQVSRPFVLHDIEKSIVQADIEIFFRHELSKIAHEFDLSSQPKLWPSDTELQELVNRAGSLFIVASTSVKFIADPYIGQPGDQLLALLKDDRASGSSSYKDLDQVYHHVLNTSVGGCGDANAPICVRFRQIVGAIVTALDPLPPSVLGSLMNVRTTDVYASIKFLGSVLIIPNEAYAKHEPLRTFHLSFPNYLTERCSDARFAIHPILHHTALALQCLETMNSFLKRNICNLPDPLLLNCDISDLEERVSITFLLYHKYACQHWGFHLQAAAQSSKLHPDHHEYALLKDLNYKLVEALNMFCKEKLLKWIEALSLLKCLDIVIPMISATEKWINEGELYNKEDLLALMNDCRRMTMRYFEPIRQGASHIYHTALALMPQCKIHEIYKSELQSSVRLVNPREIGWNPCMCILAGHTSYIRSVAFSHDSSKIVSGSDDQTVCIWDATTGTLINTLKGHTRKVRSVAFSHDSSKIVSGSNETVCIWDATTGTLVNRLKGHTGKVRSVAFSHDSSKIVSGSNISTVCIWDATTGTLVNTLKGHTSYVTSVAFSHDSSKIVSGSYDQT
ncbi:hypothetical protein FRC03_006319, partial [Tulasnella sp. 419]